ncbi:MAG: two component transcriptional regulator, winged helix family [Moraxellaceae bacterium]|jgi:two-component system response regulator QseB|nr:two component transcriptional regulator, winged helix family [Moraxellaceae bacterium]
MRILLAEDDIMLGEALQEALIAQGFAVDWLKDGESALEAARREDFDLLVLDLGLPRRDGMSVLAELRRRDNTVPVLILTARDATGDRIAGLDAGADDYLLKPFDIGELSARLRALLRRRAGRARPEIRHGELRVDPAAQRVFLREQEVALPRREYMLLKELLDHVGEVLTRDKLDAALYGWMDEVESNALEVHVHHLRKKLWPELIRTVRGVGYLIPKEGD